MTRYEKTMYERDLPGIRKSLESIANTLEEIKNRIIISDPGDEVDHIIENKKPYDVQGLNSSLYDYSDMD